MQAHYKTLVIATAIVGTVSAGFAVPSFAAETRRTTAFDAKSLDAAPAEYARYRGRHGWRGGGRGAAIAGAVGLGVLGAAAIAASRPAYAAPYYGYDDGYSYYGPTYAPVYDAPVYAAPPVYYDYRYGRYPDSRYRSRNGTSDPARGGR